MPANTLPTQDTHPTYHRVTEGNELSHAFVIECRMGDEELATGSALSKIQAGLIIAMKVLENKSMMEKYIEIKKIAEAPIFEEMGDSLA